MALHRDIHWIGRQWAVTGHGMQIIDQRHAGQFDIEVARLWEDDVLEHLSGQKWFNADDFSRGLAIARKRYPEPPRAVEPEPAAAPPPLPEPAPSPPPVTSSLVSEAIALPPILAEGLESKTPKAEPVKAVQAAPPEPAAPPRSPPQEDLLGKWFEAYGLNKAPAATAPEPPRDAAPPEPAATAAVQTEPIAAAEPIQSPPLPAIEAAEPPPPASSFMQMPISGRARFVRPWRVLIHSIQSYRL